jgi:nitronate monooxygenase
MITTRITEMFRLTYPLMSAPMALHCGGTLAAAVSKAGALGSFGGLHPQKGTEWLLHQIAHIRTATDRPFAVGLSTTLFQSFQSSLTPRSKRSPPLSRCRLGIRSPG